MVKNTEGSKFFSSRWATVGKIAFTGILFYWLYWIGVSTVDLADKINAASDRFTSIDSLVVEYKNEVQEWKDLLLRSDSRDTLNQNWLRYETQYQKVTVAAANILATNDSRSIKQKMQDFLEAHKANRLKYKDSVLILINSKYSARAADAAVKGIDRPLLGILESANADMHDEKDRTNNSLVASARSKIEQSLVALAFLGLLAIWVPKY